MRLGGLIVLICLVLGLIETAQVRFGGGEVVESSWWLASLRVMPSWVLLVLVSPLAVVAADRWPVRGARWGRALATHLALSVPFALLHLVLTTAWGVVRPGASGIGFAAGMGWLVSRYLAYGMLSYGALVGVIHAFRYHREASAVRKDADALVEQLEAARRKALEGKLHPHFVFNTLNAITGLASRGDQSAVVRTLEAFSELLQATLNDRPLEPVPLHEEIELLERYVDIQKVRFGDRLSVVWEVDEAARGELVPGLLLQPLVENAIVHGVGRHRVGGTVTVRASVRGAELTLEVEDSGAGSDARADEGARRAGHGIGLDSTRARLLSRFGDRATLELRPRPGEGTVVTVRLPRTG